MHPLLVCVSALCFCRLCGAGTPLCRDCRVNVIYPDAEKVPEQVPKSQRIVRIINEFRRISREELERRDQIRTHNLQAKDLRFIAKVKVGNSTRCSAALVAPSLVISSSVCFRNESPQQIEVLFTGGKKFEVDNVVKAEFCPELILLHLKTPTAINPINISHQSLQLGDNVSMMMASPDLSFYGRRRTKIISNRACKSTFMEEESVFITPNMVCAKNSITPEKCATFPGDALLMDHELSGLNIYGFRCFLNALNGDFYINLSKLQPMISDLIRKLNG
ncbi:uncharacterized protein LOC108102272 [Drosophila ficusphila]|uniref:uncharacterized protein LOC108102272 n=1 Tax=Drosophila ficusphila TaxID=30025 RepID=UPI0007E70565|nr:uncharacterized protein LOC108102272 [Drosophila ficusphila]